MQAPPPIDRKRVRPPNFHTELPPDENTTEFGQNFRTYGPAGIAARNKARGNAYRAANPPASQPPVTPAWPSMATYTAENLKKVIPGYGTSTSTFEPLHVVRKSRKQKKRRSKLTRKSRK